MTERSGSNGDDAAGVLLLSGAGLRSWTWDQVRADLSVPPAGESRAVPSRVAEYPRRRGASLAEYADAVAAQAPWPTFVVVAHSVGGVVAAEVLARHPGRVTGLLGVAAVVPRPGRSFAGSLAFPAGLVLGAVVRLVGTRPPAAAIRGGLCGGLPAPEADRIVEDFDPESPRLYLDRTSARELPAQRGYLHTDADREVTPAAQRGYAEVLGATWREHLPTGHLPMLQDPAGVARAVRRLWAGTTADG